jgi:hypothetical protein
MIDFTDFVPPAFARRKSIGDVVEIISGPFEFCDEHEPEDDKTMICKIMVQVRLPSDGMVVYNAEIIDLSIITEEDAFNDFRERL